MRQLLHQNAFQVTYNQKFEEVIKNCAEIYRPGQEGTWITTDMIEAYQHLHDLGYAESVEVWKDGMLAGGLYGIYLKDKNLFCGESMFSKTNNASKYGFIKLVQRLQKEGVRLIDCQVYTSHLQSMGAEEIPRKQFLSYLR